MITITSNISGQDLGGAAREVSEAIRRAGEVPRGVTVNVRGQVPPMQQTLSGLQIGLLLAVVVILLLLTAYFQSLRIALVVLAAIPAVIAGVALALWLTRTTLNAVVTWERSRPSAFRWPTPSSCRLRRDTAARRAGLFQGRDIGATSRLRPILMTSFAMIAGMLPMALAFGEGGEQTAPLGRGDRRAGGVDNRRADSSSGRLRRRAAARATSSPSIHPYDAQKTG